VEVSGTVAAWIAIAAVVLAVLAFVLGLAYFRTLRKVRRAQSVVLGAGREDLVNFAVSLQTRIDDLHRAVDEVAAALVRLDKRIDGASPTLRSFGTTRTRTQAASSQRRSLSSTQPARAS
jgi:hypothetical protein